VKLKRRLTLFAAVYLACAGMIGLVAYSTVSTMRYDLNELNQSHQEREAYVRLKSEINRYIMAVERLVRFRDLQDVKAMKQLEGACQEAVQRAQAMADHQMERTLLLRASDSLKDLFEVAEAIVSAIRDREPDRMLDLVGILASHGGVLADQCDQLEHSAAGEVTAALDGSERAQWRLVRFLVFSGIALFSLTLISLGQMARWVTGPIAGLIDGTRKIIDGDFAHRIGLKRRDEFGVLSQTFDEMAEVLGTSNRRLSRKLEETELLAEVARIANSTLDLNSILAMVADTVSETLQKEVCSIYLISDDRSSLVLRATRGLDPAAVGQVRIPMGEGIVGDAVRHLRTTAVADVSKDARFKYIPSIGESRYMSMLTVPIIRDDVCLGAVTLQTTTAHAYTEDETDLLLAISHSLSGAIRNAELYEGALRQFRRLKVIHELGMDISSILDLDRLLNDICRKTAEFLQAEGAIVRLLEGNLLRIRASYGLPETFDVTQPLPLGEGIAGRVALEGRPLLVTDAREMPENLRVPGIETTSVLAVPLRIGNRVIGTIGHYNKRVAEKSIGFTIEDLESLSAVAAMAAIALENARLYQEERVREEQIRRAGQRLLTLFESVQGGIITVNREHVILSANRFVERWAAQGQGLVGKTCEDVFGETFAVCNEDPVAQTFATGTPNKFTHRGAPGDPEATFEISTYPMGEADHVHEVVVFIQDITDRVRAEEEILSLYREVNNTKVYLESLINNSADAIVTTDLNNLVTSWNKGAERIYGFKGEEVIGKTLSIMPEFLLPAEAENSERVKRKETLRDMETLRRNKDGALIEVSLTLSPILDERGEVIGISGISRDITDKRRVEQELTRRNQELSRLLFISNAMRSTLDITSLLRMTLTAVTMSDGLGFNRAILFEVDEKKGEIRGVMGVGPGSLEEAWKVWGELAMERKTLEDIMTEIVEVPARPKTFLDGLAQNLRISMDETPEGVLTAVVRNREAVNVLDARSDARVDPVLIQQLGTEAFALIPLISQDKVVGVLWMDNLFNRRPITEDDIRFLSGFANHVASAIENARLFEQVSMAEAELENIFSSISDMVYFNDKDFTIRKVNKAVVERIGQPEEQIIGRKCYEVFHGMDRPWHKCPHTKTVMTGRAYMEEVEDPFLGGAFMVSSSPIFGRGGDLIGTVHISRDISESRRLREQLLRAEKMAALGEMAAKIAHEIRNPLISVGGFARRLEKKLAGSEKDYATIIVDSVNHLEVILKDILGFVRETPIIVVNGDIVEILEQIISLFAPSFKERGIAIVKDYREVSLQVPVDSNKIREAFTNLITNAEQALQTGGHIRVAISKTDSEAVIEIEDNGAGMSPDDLKHIFDPFFTTKISGTGLGLAITQRIVELHGGRIEVKSQMGVGTLFTIYLPLEEELA